ncbi:monocarboxylate transporter 12-like [Dreissena polymorpha]|uniref:Major facilitator superfamily (MFS) profile domain-containing protein n=1 Tax=Dreissena polymorpha TaxID=45954 RepID=A0A9D4MKJ5_DREPO|nr:monocarboxylate transporter 12-like [Dreissena polymorpha]XP_052276030.1 monocarboxylate transporter 12-like [Dreissena polymorpha]XP_052276033.1 monocarboxylate transporter 12-like [Dreissena polymorpha]XP_052276042.1 monocarboxylate transporter 12-like [Dreissena polymorpha]XP_052276051.1 monocarboxylate transporter 12-like [Dreissena polymorpha]KAH3879322.1 hypothetical protein DPMN_003224 [Dreissena polymorpha]
MPVDELYKKNESKRRNGSVASVGSVSSSSSISSSSDIVSEDALSYLMPPPPDGGYGWIIVVTAFTINLICDGIGFSFGIMYSELLDYFGESKSFTSWVGSLFYGSCLIGGPLASALATKFGCRRVLMGGGIVAATGTFVSAFASSIGMLCLTFGVITGLGMSMGYVTSLVMVAFYFEDRRAMATGLAVCGSGIGTFVFAPLTEFLIGLYGWRGTMIIWSGIMLHLVVCGSLLRPLEFSVEEKKQRALMKFERISRTTSFASFSNAARNLSRHGSHTEGLENEELKFEEGNLDACCHSQIEIPTFIKDNKIDIPIEILKEAQNNRAVLQDYLKTALQTVGSPDSHTNDIMKDFQSNENIKFESNENTQFESNENIKFDTAVTVIDEDAIVKLESNHEVRLDQEPIASCLKKSHHRSSSKERKHSPKPRRQVHMSTYLPLYRRGLFLRGNLAKFTRNAGRVKSNSCPELSRRFDESESDSDDEWECIWRYLHFSKQMKRVLKTMFDPSILLHPLYVIFAISNFILYFWYDVPYIFIVDRAVELGMEEKRASLLISVLGIVNTFGQITYGFMGDKNINLSVLYGCSLMSCGVAILIVPFFTEFAPLAVASALFGFFISANYSLSTVILVEYLGIDKLSNAYGLTMLVQGIANLIGPPLAALFHDSFHSYDLTFFVGGGFIVLAGNLLLIVPIMRKCRSQLRFDEATRVCTLYNAQLSIRAEEDESDTKELEQVANGNGSVHSALLVDKHTTFNDTAV